MKITLILTGKTNAAYLKTGTEEYFKRIARYVDFNIIVLADLKNVKNLTISEQKKLEAAQMLKQIKSDDYVVLLDESGLQQNSTEFAAFLNKRMVSGCKNLCFVVGGPYGFNESVYREAKDKISLSRMTFSHQIVRLLFAEQLYRAFTILANEPYHHE